MRVGARRAHSNFRLAVALWYVGRFVGSLVENRETDEGAGPGAPLIRGDMVVVLFGGVDLLAN